MDIDFVIDFAHQPAGQDENHHNILTAKRANPSPWYVFQLRHSQTNNYIQLGTQFATGSNTNTTISPIGMVNKVAEYVLQIVYDPVLTTNNFICKDMKSGNVVFSATNKFPDIADLKYLKVCLGYAQDANGNPYVAGTTVEDQMLFISGGKFWYSTGLTKMNGYRAYFDFYDD